MMSFTKSPLLNAYSISQSEYDEALAVMGEFRSSFAVFGQNLDSMGTSDFFNRANRAERFLKDFAQNYQTSKERKTLQLDLIPLIYSAEEWEILSAGVRQRARLFNALLDDLYGSQMLWKTGTLPPVLAHGNPFFLRSLWGSKPIRRIWIHLFAIDVFRNLDGTFYAQTDFMQVPPGLGTALENRLAMVRTLPEVFREIRADRVALFFQQLRETLHSISPKSNENPRVVLISPGAGIRRAEDAQLARYLGYPLVETEDLALRGHHLYLKTLGGLKPVDVLFRRLDDALCDPLELHTDGGEGTSGLVAAVHANTVSIANALGSGAAEVAGFRCFLPELCQKLLGETLLLPSPPSYWLKNAEDREAIFAAPERFSFLPFLAKADEKPKKFASLTAAGQFSLLREIQVNPEAWVAEECFTHSTVPTFHENKWVPAHVTGRFYCTAAQMNGYEIMPGGLARFMYEQDGIAHTGKKDIWVLSRGPVANFSLLAPMDEPVAITRAGGDLPSHAADNLFWLGRYMERAEFLAREIRCVAMRILEQNILDVPEVTPIFKNLRDKYESTLPSDPEGTLWNLTVKPEQEGGIGIVIEHISRLATQLRDRLTEDTWKAINAYGYGVGETTANSAMLIPILDLLISGGTAFGGIVSDNFTRGHGWRFLEIGRRIERAQKTIDLLTSVLVYPLKTEESQVALLRALLEIGDATMTYLRRYDNRLQMAPVIDLFLCDETNPRSVIFQLDAITRECALLPNSETNEILSEGGKLLLRLSTDVRLSNIHHLEFAQLAQWSEVLIHFSEILSQEYLGHAPLNHATVMATEV